MDCSDIHVAAVARWFAHGVTSDTHAVLRFTLATFFHPLGIDADSLEAEPFSTIETTSGNWWLNLPRWNPAGVDRTRPGTHDLASLIEAGSAFHVTISPQGKMALTPQGRVALDLAGRAFWETSDHGWNVVRHSYEAGRHADAFIHAAAALLLEEPNTAKLYANGRDAAFCAAVLTRLPPPIAS